MAALNLKSANTPSHHRPVSARCRKDLVATPVARRGGVTYVVKDPIAMQFTHLPEDEYFLLSQLNGQKSLEQICSAYESRFQPKKLSSVKLNELLFRFHRFGLLQSSTSGQGLVMNERATKHRLRKWQQALMSPLFIRFPGVNPNRWLNATIAWVRPCFHPLCIAGMLLCMLLGLGLFALHADQYFAELFRLERWRRLESYLLLGAAIGATKIIHELAHAYTCKYFGGECQAIGPMLLLFSPALYCDTSDSWRMPNRWHRAAIGVAGIFVECFLAAIATMIWLSTPPGLMHYVAMDVMLVCSISTVVFNANPLMRYDGYFVLSDLWDQPNLSQRSQQLLVTTLRGVCFTGESCSESLPPAEKIGLLAYGAAAFAYRWFVTLTILLVLVKLMRDWQVESLGWSLVAFTLTVSSIGFWKSGIKAMQRPTSMRWLNSRTFATLFTSSAIVALLFYPWPARVAAVATITAHDAEPVYAVVPGFIEQIVSAGQKVEEGQAIAKLRNSAIELDYRQAQGNFEKQKQLVELLTRATVLDAQHSRKVTEAQARLEDLSTQLNIQQARIDALTVTAHHDGLVLRGDEQPHKANDEDQLSDWTGFVTDPKNRGCYVKGGTILCRIASPDRYEAELLLPQSTAKRVANGAAVSLVSTAAPQSVQRGEVFQISRRNMSTEQGDIDATEAVSSLAEATKTSEVAYLLRVKLNEQEAGLLMEGQQSDALVRTAPESIASRIWSSLAAMFRLR